MAIRPTGFFRNKARSIQGTAAYLLEHHGGEVPETIDELVELPGVGRKTANVVLGTYFSRNEGVVVDTPSGGLSAAPRPDHQHGSGEGRARTDGPGADGGVDHLLPPPHLVRARVCTAKDPRCDRCELADVCPSAFKVGRFAKAAPRARR